MVLARFERDFTDDAGNLLTGDVMVEVRRMSGGLPQLYSDRDGALALGNPFTNDGGAAAFHVVGGSYRVTVTQGSFSRELIYVPIGRAAETDLQIATPEGAWDNAATYAAGSLVTHPEGQGLFISLQDDNLNHEPDDGTPGDNDWWMYLGIAATGDPGPQGEPGPQGDPGDQGAPGDDGADGTDPGVLLTWDDGNTDANPGAGNIRADNDALGSATMLYVSKTNRAGDDISAFLAALDDSTNTVKGQVTITRSSGNAQAGFNITGITDASGYAKVAVSGHWGATGFIDGNAISFQFSRAGNKGADGAGTVAGVGSGTGIDVDSTDPANPVVSVEPNISAVAAAFTAASSSGPASLALAEDTDNGSNKVSLKAPASIAADVDLTLPGTADTLVGRATTDTLTNKTLVDPAITGTILEDVYTIIDGAAFEIDPGNGSIQQITLGASRTPAATNFANGEGILLMVNDGTAYTITWTTVGVVWIGGSAPTLATSGWTHIVLYKVAGTIYGKHVGDSA